MTLQTALTVALAIFVFGLTPGPGVFAIVARALALGFRPTLVFILGIITGDFVCLVFAVLGLSVTLGNPKVVVFYVAFLPAFVDLGSLSLVDLVAVSGVVILSLLASLLFYAGLAAKARDFFCSARAVRNLRRGAGGLMIGAGGTVAAS